MKYLYSLLFILAVTVAMAQPVTMVDSISIRKVMAIPNSTATRIVVDPRNNDLYYAAVGGEIYKLDVEKGTKTQVFSASDHGLKEVYGFDIGKSGNVYLVSMDPADTKNNIAYVKKYDSTKWTLMVKANYPRSSRDHRFNMVLESADQQYILVNSGARTDHGEMKSNNQRENAFTAKLLKFPVGTENLTLQDDDTFMKDYLFATGLRNTYDLAYNKENLLFGVDQANQSDHQEELNFIEEGKHYGFPWVLGPDYNRMQYKNFNPPTSDPLITSVNMESTFYNDPTFPTPPAGVTFMAPIPNYGPDMDRFRDTVESKVKDASDLGTYIGTFTPHNSPVGLTFDLTDEMPGRYKSGAFCVSWSAPLDRKFKPFNDTYPEAEQLGNDLLFIDLEKSGDSFQSHIYRLARNFNHPVDAAVLGNKMYIIEHTSGSSLWEVTFELPPVVEKEVLSANDKISRGLHVYPNSFIDKVNITLDVDLAGAASLKVFSLDGKELNTLWEGDYRSGHKIQLGWNGKDQYGSKLNRGVYVLRFKVGDASVSHRIVKLD